MSKLIVFSSTKRLWRWLWSARLAWLTIGVVLIAGMVTIWLGSEPAFRLIGLVLQLLGVATVYVNIRGTQKHFGRPGPFAWTRDWLRQWPWKKRPPIVATLNATLSAATMMGTVELWTNPVDQTPEARIATLEANTSSLRDNQRQLHQDMDRDRTEQRSALAQEMNTRISADRAISERLETVQVSGLHVSLAGIVWLVGGMIMSTASPELVWLFSRLGI